MVGKLTEENYLVTNSFFPDYTQGIKFFGIELHNRAYGIDVLVDSHIMMALKESYYRSMN